MPHAFAALERVADGRIEVLTVYEEMVGLRHITTRSVLHDGMSEDDGGILCCHGTVGGIGLGVGRICEVVGDHFVGLAVGVGGIFRSLRCVDEPVPGVPALRSASRPSLSSSGGKKSGSPVGETDGRSPCL